MVPLVVAVSVKKAQKFGIQLKTNCFKWWRYMGFKMNFSFFLYYTYMIIIISSEQKKRLRLWCILNWNEWDPIFVFFSFALVICYTICIRIHILLKESFVCLWKKTTYYHDIQLATLLNIYDNHIFVSWLTYIWRWKL